MVDHIRPSIASVVGIVTDMKWGQVLQTPHAYGVLEVHTPDGVARVRGVQLLTKLTHAFSEQPLSLSELGHLADEVMNEEIVSLILMVPVGMTLYVVSRGNGRVYLRRENKLARLLEGAQSLSGDVRAEDTIIAATHGFIEALTQEEIIGVFDHLSASDVAEKLTIRLHERSGGEGGAALIFQVHEAPPEGRAAVGVAQGGADTITVVGSSIPISRRVKAMGRRMMSANQRIRVRLWLTKIRASKRLTPRHILVYAIVGFFLLSVVFGIRRQMLYGAQTKITETLVEAQHSFDEGMALLDLNPVKGRERLTAARDLLSPVVSRKLRSEEAKKAKALYDEVVANLTRAMRVSEVTPQLYFDMGLLKGGSKATDISLFDTTIGIVDGPGKTVYTLGTETKNGTIVGGGEGFSGATHIAAYGDKLYVWTPQGIHQVRLSDQKTTRAIIPASPEWGVITDMVAFGGNLYLLDTAKSRIWKYVATEKGFSELFEYLNPDTLPDLSHTTNITIDGSVWLGTTTGTIMRFTSGKENSYSPQGVEMPLGKRLIIYTHDEIKMVYVLDSDNHRVVVFDKDGLYISQYTWEAAFAPAAIAAAEDVGKLFLLRDGKIYTIDLK